MTAPRKTGKTGSRNPAAKPTSVSAWKKSSLAPVLELPSGKAMRVKKVGLPTLMKLGIMPNSLMGIAQKAVGKGTGKADEMSQEEMAELISDPKKMNDIADAMDGVLIFVAQEPQVYPLPGDGVEKDPELLYVDEVDDEDKLFVFQAVTGGTTEVESFREEHVAGMAAIRGLQDVELPAE
jgi:hypothetical protein